MTSREQAKAIKMGADMLSVLGRRYRRCKDLLALAHDALPPSVLTDQIAAHLRAEDIDADDRATMKEIERA